MKFATRTRHNSVQTTRFSSTHALSSLKHVFEFALFASRRNGSGRRFGANSFCYVPLTETLKNAAKIALCFVPLTDTQTCKYLCYVPLTKKAGWGVEDAFPSSRNTRAPLRPCLTLMESVSSRPCATRPRVTPLESHSYDNGWGEGCICSSGPRRILPGPEGFPMYGEMPRVWRGRDPSYTMRDDCQPKGVAQHNQPT
jgi:hypothetical protein